MLLRVQVKVLEAGIALVPLVRVDPVLSVQEAVHHEQVEVLHEAHGPADHLVVLVGSQSDTPSLFYFHASLSIQTTRYNYCF